MLVPVKALVSQGKCWLLLTQPPPVGSCLLNDLNKLKEIYLKFKLQRMLKAVQLFYEGIKRV